VGAQGTWALVGSVFFSGPSSATDSPGGDYADNVDTALELDVPVRLGTSGVLSFRHICITEATYDFGYVEISADAGQTWNVLAAYDMNDHAGWTTASPATVTSCRSRCRSWLRQPGGARPLPPGDRWRRNGGWLVHRQRQHPVERDRVPEIPAFVNALHANEPNPFNPSTTIRYSLAAPGRVDLRIHDLRGRVVRTLVAAERPAGGHMELWDGRDDAGRRVASGVYFYRIETGAFVQARKMLLLK